LRTYEFGERIIDRIDFEELALKGVDPTLGPSIPNSDIARQDANEVENSEKQIQKETLRVSRTVPYLSVPSYSCQIPLVYPPSIYASLPSTSMDEVSHPSVMHLRTLLASREPRHRKGFWMWMAIAPLTAPFILVRESSDYDMLSSHMFGVH
jgi:hypothetical protein